ncbi:hypothetical protein [Lysobacter fragariae]
MPASPTLPSPQRRWLAHSYRLAMLLGACAGFAAIWVVIAWTSNRQCGWLAVLGALDVAWMLRLAGWPRGWRRALAGVAATAAIVVVANWWIIAAQVGSMLGLQPLESALKLGFHYGWLMAQLANSTFDIAMIAVALVVAALASR